MLNITVRSHLSEHLKCFQYLWQWHKKVSISFFYKKFYTKKNKKILTFTLKHSILEFQDKTPHSILDLTNYHVKVLKLGL